MALLHVWTPCMMMSASREALFQSQPWTQQTLPESSLGWWRTVWNLGRRNQTGVLIFWIFTSILFLCPWLSFCIKVTQVLILSVIKKSLYHWLGSIGLKYWGTVKFCFHRYRPIFLKIIVQGIQIRVFYEG